MKRMAVSFCVLLFAGAPARADERATVESIDILIAESFPVQVFAHLRGYVGDGCTKITSITSRGPVGWTFHIEISTHRPPEAICTQVLMAFERNVPLDAYGLAAGTYEVISGGARASFTLTQDNRLQ